MEPEVNQKTKKDSKNLETGEAVALIITLMLSHIFLHEVGSALKGDVPAAHEAINFILDPGKLISRKINQMKKGNSGGKVWDEITFQWINDETYKHMFSDPIVRDYRIAIQTMHRERENISKSKVMAAGVN